SVGDHRNIFSIVQTEGHHSHNTFRIDFSLSAFHVDLTLILACDLHQHSHRSCFQTIGNTNRDWFLDHNSSPPCSLFSSSAILLSFLSLWLTPDLPTAGDNIAPSSASVASGNSSRSFAICSNPSGRAENPIFSCMKRISSICLTAAWTVLLMFAVSQLTFRLTLPRISFRIRTFSRFITDTFAPMIPSSSTICAPSLT